MPDHPDTLISMDAFNPEPELYPGGPDAGGPEVSTLWPPGYHLVYLDTLRLTWISLWFNWIPLIHLDSTLVHLDL